jgi:hypothetical protein
MSGRESKTKKRDKVELKKERQKGSKTQDCNKGQGYLWGLLLPQQSQMAGSLMNEALGEAPSNHVLGETEENITLVRITGDSNRPPPEYKYTVLPPRQPIGWKEERKQQRIKGKVDERQGKGNNNQKQTKTSERGNKQ